MNLNELRDTSYEIAKSKGWHDADIKRSFADLMALVISELVEALEEYRTGRPANEIHFPELLAHDGDAMTCAAEGYKPEGVVIELADALIRIGDCAGEYELDLEREDYGPTVKELVAGGDGYRSFGDGFCQCAGALCELGIGGTDDGISLLDAGAREIWLPSAASTIGSLAHWLGITGEELERAVEIKHAYNRTRPHRHGNKVL